VGPEPMNDFERELQQGMLRLPAPPGLKRKIMARKKAGDAERTHRRVVFWQRLAASVVLCGAVGGGVTWHNIQEQRKGEAARRQVMMALRIAGRALDQMNEQLAEHNEEK
jgi:hypothetical protein